MRNWIQYLYVTYTVHTYLHRCLRGPGASLILQGLLGTSSHCASLGFRFWLNSFKLWRTWTIWCKLGRTWANQSELERIWGQSWYKFDKIVQTCETLPGAHSSKAAQRCASSGGRFSANSIKLGNIWTTLCNLEQTWAKQNKLKQFCVHLTPVWHNPTSLTTLGTHCAKLCKLGQPHFGKFVLIHKHLCKLAQIRASLGKLNQSWANL